MNNKFSLISNGILKDNPVLKLILGTCPTLAVTVTVMGGVGMGLAATFVLIGSNVVIAALRKVIPDKVRIPCFITVIATFVTLVMMIVEAFLPDLYSALGIFLPLIVVNCIILGRAEMFASKNTVLDSFLDAIGMGIGFTLTLLLMGTIREVLGSGTWFGLRVIPQEYTIGIMTMTPGGFFTYGILIAILAAYLSFKGRPVKFKASGCGACGGCKKCGPTEEGSEA